MKPLKTIRKNKSAIAYLFAISILAVTSCDVLCSIDRSAMAGVNEHDQLALNHHMNEAKSDHHKHDESHNHQASTEDITEHTHAGSSSDQDDDCCKDITNQFYKSLFNGGDAGAVKAPVHTFILLTGLNNYHPITSILYQNPSRFLPYLPPKIAGSHLRILINSFLI